MDAVHRHADASRVSLRALHRVSLARRRAGRRARHPSGAEAQLHQLHRRRRGAHVGQRRRLRAGGRRRAHLRRGALSQLVRGRHRDGQGSRRARGEEVAQVDSLRLSPMTTELHELPITELARLIAARKLSPVELLDALIQRVEQYDAQTRAFITPTFDLARRQAKAAAAEIAAGTHRGALHGIPFALKDIYDTRGILTSGHSRVFANRIPTEDAAATTKLYEAGAVLLGKLATHEMRSEEHTSE